MKQELMLEKYNVKLVTDSERFITIHHQFMILFSVPLIL